MKTTTVHLDIVCPDWEKCFCFIAEDVKTNRFFYTPRHKEDEVTVTLSDGVLSVSSKEDVFRVVQKLVRMQTELTIRAGHTVAVPIDGFLPDECLVKCDDTTYRLGSVDSNEDHQHGWYLSSKPVLASFIECLV